MKPVIDNFIPFTPERVSSIRFTRDFVLAEGKAAAFAKGAKRKRSTSPDGPKRSHSRLKPVTLTKESRKILAGLDPEMQAMFKEMTQ